MTSGIPRFKVILCGDYGVGKSSLFRRFRDDRFSSRDEPRASLDTCTQTFLVKNQPVELTLWDTAGLERFSSMSSSYYLRASAAIICYSLVDRDSFDHIQHHITEIRFQRTWPEDGKLFLCGTKLEDANGDVLGADATNLCEQRDITRSYVVSSKKNMGVQEMFEDVARCLVARTATSCDLVDSIRLRGRKAHAKAGERGCC